MNIKGNAFEIGGRAFLNDIDKYDTIPKYIDATIERAKKPGNGILEFPITFAACGKYITCADGANITLQTSTNRHLWR